MPNKCATFQENASTSLNAMHRVKAEAFKMKEHLLKGDFQAFTNGLRQG